MKKVKWYILTITHYTPCHDAMDWVPQWPKELCSQERMLLVGTPMLVRPKGRGRTNVDQLTPKKTQLQKLWRQQIKTLTWERTGLYSGDLWCSAMEARTKLQGQIPLLTARETTRIAVRNIKTAKPWPGKRKRGWPHNSWRHQLGTNWKEAARMQWRRVDDGRCYSLHE